MTLPRVQISLILMVTCVAGFISSMLLLAAGLDSMAVRYPLVVAIAYGTFLVLLKIWLWIQKYGGADIADMIIDGPYPSSQTDNFLFGGGGDYAGAGSGGQWSEARGVVDTPSASSGSNSVDIDIGLDGDDLGLLIVAVVALLAALLAIFYVIYIAPVLLAEIVIDGLLVSGLYRTMRNVERRHWLTTAIKKTALPAVLVAVLLGIFGWAGQKIAPEARSVGGVVRSVVN